MVLLEFSLRKAYPVSQTLHSRRLLILSVKPNTADAFNRSSKMRYMIRALLLLKFWAFQSSEVLSHRAKGRPWFQSASLRQQRMPHFFSSNFEMNLDVRLIMPIFHFVFPGKLRGHDSDLDAHQTDLFPLPPTSKWHLNLDLISRRVYFFKNLTALMKLIWGNARYTAHQIKGDTPPRRKLMWRNPFLSAGQSAFAYDSCFHVDKWQNRSTSLPSWELRNGREENAWSVRSAFKRTIKNL